ncbi:MAG: CBS domain-containing protein [Candidatus Rokubacteria bacterium]|nr:CBS domain-containing protein [Candidatus Rokubacteria bacterium]
MHEASVREIGDVTIDALMSKPVRTVTPETTIDELTELMAVYDYNGFPVVDAEGILHGLVTRTDVFKLYLEPYRRPTPAGTAATVGHIMSHGVIVVRPDERVFTAIALMVEHRVVTIPVVTPTAKGPRVVGVITRRDAAGALKP